MIKQSKVYMTDCNKEEHHFVITFVLNKEGKSVEDLYRAFNSGFKWFKVGRKFVGVGQTSQHNGSILGTQCGESHEESLDK